MEKSRPRENGVAPRTSKGSHDEFVWPPPDEDIEGCAIVSLGEGPAPIVPIVTVRVVPVEPNDDTLTVANPAPAGASRAAHPTSASHAHPHPRRWGVEHPDAHFPFAPEADAVLDDDPWSKRELSRAGAAVLVGVSLALLSFVEFRGLPRHRPQAPPVPVHAVMPEAPVPEPAAPVPSRALVRSAGLSLLRGAPLSDATPAVAAAVQPAIVRAEQTASQPVAIDDAAPPEVEPIATSAALDDQPRIEARPIAAELASMPAPIAALAPTPVTAALVDTQAREEDRIRTTLAQWRDAYSQLDASAAREVWPSVDIRALERAFQALKSQDLRFDRCDFTVNGSHAQAACTGRASYVPRVGNTSPRTNAREWTFELTRSDDRWMIATATARSS